MPNGDYPYNYERCFNNAEKIEKLEEKIDAIMENLHMQDKITQRWITILETTEKNQKNYKIQNRWIFGLLVTIVLGIVGLVVRTWLG